MVKVIEHSCKVYSWGKSVDVNAKVCSFKCATGCENEKLS
jgi:hypothetical protein